MASDDLPGVRARVANIVAGVARTGFPFDIVTGAGTGTYDIDSEDHVFTELQTGSYVFMDAEYAGVLAEGVNASPFEIALFVQTAVVSVNNPDWVTVDGGTKSFATDGGVPVVARGVDLASRYAFFGDEHGKLMRKLLDFGIGNSECRPSALTVLAWKRPWIS